MTPIGGVGINVAVQDAVAAANALAGPMAAGEDVDPLLHRVQKRRLPAVRIIQSFQKAAQDRIIGRLLMRQGGDFEPPRALRWLDRYPVLRRIPAALIGFGYRAEHVASPSAEPMGRGTTRRGVEG
jgi:2-polyprenyl-6-methoxyphenol hydroxylase-like FAD-dependent oxidoreductase